MVAPKLKAGFAGAAGVEEKLNVGADAVAIAGAGVPNEKGLGAAPPADTLDVTGAAAGRVPPSARRGRPLIGLRSIGGAGPEPVSGVSS